VNKRNISLTTDSIKKIPSKIHNKKVIRGTTYYLMSWKGFDPNEISWISKDQITDIQLIQLYYKKLRKGKN
ncbi:hypothetical protein PIROE2DRAFT_27514, partial [Piromyces sp. E2]